MIKKTMSNRDYHEHSAIGSTTAKLALDSREYYDATIQGRVPKLESAALDCGSDFHALVLEPEKQDLISDGPINEKTGAAYGRQTKAFQNWRAENPDLILVDDWMQESISGMPDEVKNVIYADTAEREISIFANVNGLNAKCRPDVWVRETNTVYDLKTITPKSPDIDRAIDGQIASLSYWFSMAWYRSVIQSATDTQKPPAWAWIFAETKSPYRWRIVRPDAEYIELADRVCADLMQKLTKPAAPEDVAFMASPPNWLIHKYENGASI